MLKLDLVYGMGTDLITILATMGTLFAGSPLSLHPGFSIGGPPSKSSDLLGNVLGVVGSPQGLNLAHNAIESDSSGTRDDLYVTGDAHTMNMTLFNMLTTAADANGGHLTMDDILKRAAERFDESIAINPYFYYGPLTGMIFRNAGYFFMGRLLANHTTEYPDGGLISGFASIPSSSAVFYPLSPFPLLSYIIPKDHTLLTSPSPLTATNVLKSFFAIDFENVYKKGHERIPTNWYRTSTDYGLVQLNLDIISMIQKYPVLGSIGGNTAGVGTFSGVNLEDVSGGVLNSATLLDGNNLLCFILQVVDTFAPDTLSSLFKTLDAPLKLLGSALSPISTLGCPAMGDLSMGGKDLWDGLLDKYPGARKSGTAM
jgi:hypothetical protein